MPQVSTFPRSPFPFRVSIRGVSHTGAAAKDLLSLCSPGFFDHSNLCNEHEKLTPRYLLAAR